MVGYTEVTVGLFVGTVVLGTMVGKDDGKRVGKDDGKVVGKVDGMEVGNWDGLLLVLG